VNAKHLFPARFKATRSALTLLTAMMALTTLFAAVAVRADQSETEEAQSSAVVGPAVAGVYRWVGADGVVEFNNYGLGEPVSVAPVAPLDPLAADVVRTRQEDMLRVAAELAAERKDREASRLAAAQLQRSERDRQREADARRTQEVGYLSPYLSPYDPRFLPGYSPYSAPRYLRRDFRRDARARGGPRDSFNDALPGYGAAYPHTQGRAPTFKSHMGNRAKKGNRGQRDR